MQKCKECSLKPICPVKEIAMKITANNLLLELDKRGLLVTIMKNLALQWEMRLPVDVKYIAANLYEYVHKPDEERAERAVGAAVMQAAEMMLKAVECSCQKYDSGCPNCHFINCCNQRNKEKGIL